MCSKAKDYNIFVYDRVEVIAKIKKNPPWSLGVNV